MTAKESTMSAALRVILNTPAIRDFLKEHDPMALRQVEAALVGAAVPEMGKPINRALGATVHGIGVIPDRPGFLPSWVVACELPAPATKLHPLVVWVAVASSSHPGELYCTGGEYFRNVDEWAEAFWARMDREDAYLQAPPHAALHLRRPKAVKAGTVETVRPV